jgi:hypothetical protein
MLRARFVLLAIWAYATLLLPTSMAQTTNSVPRPPAGQTVDESRTITLMPLPHGECVSLVQNGVHILLPRLDLEALVRRIPSQPWQTEDERMAFVQGSRARNLLEQLGSAVDAHGCLSVQAPLNADARVIWLSQLEQGRAAITYQSEAVLNVRIRYVGDRCGPLCGRGLISVHLPETETPFLVFDWWIS